MNFNFIDLTGKKFGKLLVLKRAEKKPNSRTLRWECLCDCGKTKIINGSDLKRKYTVSCGCYAKYITKITHMKPKGVGGFNRVLDSYTSRCKRLKREFLLTEEQFKQIISNNCFYCNIEPNQIKYSCSFSQASEEARNNSKFLYNGIDRIDSNLGYTLTNSRTCCRICNIAKSNMSETEFFNWIKRVNDNLILKENNVTKNIL